MNADELRGIVNAELGEYAGVAGSVMYSGLDTIRPGRFYFAGYNPAGSPNPIRDSIQDRAEWSAYTHECWRCDHAPCVHIGPDAKLLDPALKKHQRNVLQVAWALHTSPEEVCCTNAIFATSKDAASLKATTGLSEREWWAKCWPVHQRLLSEVRPRLIVTMGLRTFELFRARAAEAWDVGEVPYDGAIRGGLCSQVLLRLREGVEPLNVMLLAVPHPSYHAISADFDQWINYKLS